MVQVRLPEELYKQVKKSAKHEQRTIQAQLERLVSLGLLANTTTSNKSKEGA